MSQVQFQMLWMQLWIKQRTLPGLMELVAWRHLNPESGKVSMGGRHYKHERKWPCLSWKCALSLGAWGNWKPWESFGSKFDSKTYTSIHIWKTRKDSRHRGLQNPGDYGEVKSFNLKTLWSSPFPKQRMTSCLIDLLCQGSSRMTLILIFCPTFLMRTFIFVTPCFPKSWLEKYGLCHHRANAGTVAEILLSPLCKHHVEKAMRGDRLINRGSNSLRSWGQYP